jgi:hypothetical protein
MTVREGKVGGGRIIKSVEEERKKINLRVEARI